MSCEERNVHANCSKRCDHCKNKNVCEIKSEECDNQGCANNKYRHPLCKGESVFACLYIFFLIFMTLKVNNQTSGLTLNLVLVL